MDLRAPRTRLLLLAAATLVVVAAVLVLRGGDGDVRIERGLADRGFPLRGSLADDRDAIEDAVEAWREDRGEPVEDDEDEERRFEDDEEVAVLWIGRVPDRELAILEQDDRIAEVRRREDGGWRVTSVTPWERSFDPAPLSYPGGVLLPAGRELRYVAGDRRRFSDAPATVDGLLTGEGRFSGRVRDGFVFPPQAEGPDRSTVVLVRGIGLRRIPAQDYDRFLAHMDDGGAVALFLAFAAAAERDGEGRPRRTTGAPPDVSLVWSGRLPGRDAAVVVSERGRTLGLGVDDPSAEDDDVAESVPLGGGPATGLGSGGAPGGVGVGRVRTSEGPRLVVAGVGVERLELLAGEERFDGPAPVLVARAPWLDDDPRQDEPRDVVVFGRTADGAVVAPFARTGR